MSETIINLDVGLVSPLLKLTRRRINRGIPHSKQRSIGTVISLKGRFEGGRIVDPWGGSDFT